MVGLFAQNVVCVATLQFQQGLYETRSKQQKKLTELDGIES